jgi:hypothetical protein
MADAMKVWAMQVFSPYASFRSCALFRSLSVLALGAVLGTGAPSAGWAQLNSAIPGGGRASSVTSRAAPEKPVVPAPDAVPGSKARAPVAPPTHVAGDLPPTEALFDAINRGDIASARDALNRGADLNGVNVLGMTPMELSVDLGRNDISFLLLSMRGEDSGRGSRAVGRDDGDGGAASRTALPVKAAKEAKPGGRAKAADIPVATRAIATPKLFANDGGTPMPNVGFLGFDTRSAAN